MVVLKLVGIALIASTAALVLRAYRPDIGMQIGIAAGIVILLFALGEADSIFSFIGSAIERFGLSSEYLSIMIKVIGIAYLVQFAADICRDAGESAVAGKVELAGRLAILTMSMPVIIAVLDIVAALVPVGA